MNVLLTLQNLNLAQPELSKTVTFILAVSIPLYIAIKYLKPFKPIKVIPYEILYSGLNNENTAKVKTFLKIHFNFWASESEISHLRILINNPEVFYGYIENKRWLKLNSSTHELDIYKHKKLKTYLGIGFLTILISCFITFLQIENRTPPLDIFLITTGLMIMVSMIFMLSFYETLSHKSANRFFSEYYSEGKLKTSIKND